MIILSLKTYESYSAQAFLKVGQARTFCLILLFIEINGEIKKWKVAQEILSV